jgi:hypothetical protein
MRGKRFQKKCDRSLSKFSSSKPFTSRGEVDWEAQQPAYVAVVFSIFAEVKTEPQWKP